MATALIPVSLLQGLRGGGRERHSRGEGGGCRLAPGVGFTSTVSPVSK